MQLILHKILNYYLSIKLNSVEPEMEVNPSEPTDRSTKSFGSDNAAFTESICKKVASENMSLEQLQTTLRNIQVFKFYCKLNNIYAK